MSAHTRTTSRHAMPRPVLVPRQRRKALGAIATLVGLSLGLAGTALLSGVLDRPAPREVTLSDAALADSATTGGAARAVLAEGVTMSTGAAEEVGTEVGEGYFESSATGRFVMVRVDVDNASGRWFTFPQWSAGLVDADGNRYPLSPSRLDVAGADLLLLGDLDPRTSALDVPLLFDVPATAEPVALEIEVEGQRSEQVPLTS